ncbi:MAG: RNA methyltransferase [Candidatus Cloacimonetes bacterium]|nr:RNA methyltransferase [Candidatus Cloacimonadota bacterium]
MANLHLALLHYPVLNKTGERITSSITNLDLHDISRAAYSYGASSFWVVHPDEAQTQLLKEIIGFWQASPQLPYNPKRSEALGIIRHSHDFDTMIDKITTQEAARPIIISTTARTRQPQISYTALRSLCRLNRPILIVFGTGFGLCEEIHAAADHILAPITGVRSFNHLSVRSAVAVILDRLASENIYGRNHGYSAHSWQRPNQNRLSRVSRRRHREGPL